MPTALQPLPWHTFHLPKKGNSVEEYEDAFAGNAARARFAVADGASESSFAGLWARLLVEGFVRAAKPPWQDPTWLLPLRKRWATEVGKAPLPWYAEMKRDDGAFATLLGFAVRRPNHWRAIAVGDSCLVQLRGGDMVTSFPMQSAAEFGNQPDLICSRARGGAETLKVRKKTGTWQPGDVFLLMTDALAQWFLDQQEQGNRPWQRLAPLRTADDPEAAFRELIAELRANVDLRNDDVTLLLTEARAEVTPLPKGQIEDNKQKE